MAPIDVLITCFILAVTLKFLLLVPDCNATGRKLFAIVALGTLVLATMSATAGELNPYSTAAEHAGMAAQAKDLSEIHQHLQNVLNCLEGPTGKDFQSSAGNPCTGKGALQTLPKGSLKLVRARKVIALAREGVKLQDVPPAHRVARAIKAILAVDRQR
ncbi:MAG: hypothetical protein ABSF90_28415 [Syntrophobacteraceae bacterium]|jgi:hypothetical protein